MTMHFAADLSMNANLAVTLQHPQLHLLDEVTDDALALSQLRHAECAQLVQLHDSRHGGEDHTCVQALTLGRDSLNNL
jgi:hypothetical protein